MEPAVRSCCLVAQLGTTSCDVNFPAALKRLQFVILLVSLFNVTVALALFVVVFVHFFFLYMCVCIYIYTCLTCNSFKISYFAYCHLDSYNSVFCSVYLLLFFCFENQRAIKEIITIKFPAARPCSLRDGSLGGTRRLTVKSDVYLNGKFIPKQPLDQQWYVRALLQCDNILMNSKEDVIRLNVRLRKSSAIPCDG